MSAGEESNAWFGPFREGDRVKVIAGPFEGFDGVVQEVNPHRATVRLIVTILAQPTPIELKPSDLELL